MGHSYLPLSCTSLTPILPAARKDPKEIWDESEIVDMVEDDIDDGRTVPECVPFKIMHTRMPAACMRMCV